MPDIPLPQFRPVATPVNAVPVQTRMIEGVQPVAPVRAPAPIAPNGITPPGRGPSNLGQLAEALSALNPRITAAADSYFKGVNEQDGLEAELRAVRDNVTSWSEAVKADPTLADRSPYFRQVYEGRAARTRIQKRAGEMLGEYYTSPIAGSDDPGAINKWLADGMQATIDSASSPAERASMIEELKRTSQQFLSAHRENAVRNLLQRNQDSVGRAMGTAIDNHLAQGANHSPAGSTVAAGPDGKPVGDYYRALGGAESEGGKNIPNRAGTSSAFGPYQFTEGTWKGMMKAHPELGLTAAGRFDPAQQHKAIRAFTEDNGNALNRAGVLVNDKNLYMAHFLGAQGGVRFLKGLKADPEGVAALYADPAAVVANRSVFYDQGGRARTTTEVFARMTRKFGTGQTFMAVNNGAPEGAPQGATGASGGTPTGQPGTAASGAPGGLSGASAVGAPMQALTSNLQAIEQEARVQGMAPAQVNKLTLTAITQAMVTHGREDFAEVALQPRPDGTPGAGTTLEGRQMIEAARMEVRRNRVTKENQQHALEARQREDRKRAASSLIIGHLLTQMDQDEPPMLDTQVLRRAAEMGPEVAEHALAIQRNLETFDKSENRLHVSQFAAGIYAGQGTPEDVLGAIRTGLLKDPTTIRNLFEEARRNMDRTFTGNRAVTQSLDDVRTLVGKPSPLTAVLNNPEGAVQAASALRMSIITFQKNKPAASEAEIAEYAQQERDRIVKLYNPDSRIEEQRADNMSRKPATGAPNQTPRPGQSAATAPAQDEAFKPRPGVDFVRTPLFPDAASLETAIEEARKKPGPSSVLFQWFKATGAKNITEVIEAQRRLLAQGTPLPPDAVDQAQKKGTPSPGLLFNPGLFPNLFPWFVDPAFRPRPGVDYTQTPLFPDAASLESAVSKAIRHPKMDSVLFQWQKATNANSINDIIQAQRRLLAQPRP